MFDGRTDPFYNVRKGGPKERRIRRVELMGEHKPKELFYVKVTQKFADDTLPTLECLKEEFSWCVFASTNVRE